MSSGSLVVLIGGTEAGEVRRDRSGRLRFVYAEAFRRRDEAVHLSLSMPVAGDAYGHAAVDAYLWGLLPDNAYVLERWGQRLQVSPRNAFGLLAHVGEECAGSVQLVRPERVAAAVGDGPIEVAWLDEAQVAARLRALRLDQSAWRSPSDAGQFSLAGAQPKTAFLGVDGRFGVPSGRTPTTHILKPPHRDVPGHVENEHVCLRLARALGLTAAHSEVRRFDGEVAIVVERYDRVVTRPAAGRGGTSGLSVTRIHQEDLCQALGVHPARKYQAEGGPTPRRIGELLRTHSSAAGADLASFLDALIFNWLVAGTDGHGKNYSLLHAEGGRVRLAPLYDLASALLVPGLDRQRLRLAMRVGSSYAVPELGARNWEACAADLGLEGSVGVDRARDLARRLPDALRSVELDVVRDGLDATVVARLAALVTDHVRRCSAALDA